MINYCSSLDYFMDRLSRTYYLDRYLYYLEEQIVPPFHNPSSYMTYSCVDFIQSSFILYVHNIWLQFLYQMKQTLRIFPISFLNNIIMNYIFIIIVSVMIVSVVVTSSIAIASIVNN